MDFSSKVVSAAVLKKDPLKQTCSTVLPETKLVKISTSVVHVRVKEDSEDPLMKNQLWNLWRPRFHKVCL